MSLSFADLSVDIAESPWGRKSQPTGWTLGEGDRRLAAIFDASGSWGLGPDAAAFARRHLEPRWRSAFESLQARGIADGLKGIRGLLPLDLRDEEFGCEFSAAVALVARVSGRAGFVLDLVCAGIFAVCLVRDRQPRALFQPRRLIDQLVAEARISDDDVADFAHKQVCVGPFVADGTDGDYFVTQILVERGDRIVMGHRDLIDAILDAPRRALGAAVEIQRRSPREHAATVVVVDVANGSPVLDGPKPG